MTIPNNDSITKSILSDDNSMTACTVTNWWTPNSIQDNCAIQSRTL